MSIEVKVPVLGESIVEATVGRWLKQLGDAVKAGEALVELETDKVNMEVVAPESGTLESIGKQEGETVGIDDVLATMQQGSSVADPASNGAATEKSSDPVSTVPTAPLQSAVTSSPDDYSAPASPELGNQAEDKASRSTPLARRIAAEHGLDLASIPGSGPSGRVTQDDVTAFMASQAAEEPSRPAPPLPVPPRRQPSTPAEQRLVGMEPRLAGSNRSETRERMSRRRLTIARRLVEAQHTAAMLTTFNEVDMTGIMDIRARRRNVFKEKHGIGLGFMSFFTKAVVSALMEFPRLNAEIQGDEMVLKHYYDIGIAVGSEEGLVVPVMRDANTLTFAQIEQEIAALAAKARNRQLSLEDLTGGTFTISNGGIYGSLQSTPILNAPQVGILGMHKIQERPIALNGQVVIRPMMYLALSYDHRIVDGNEAVRFLVRIKDLLEDPTLLLIES